ARVVRADRERPAAPPRRRARAHAPVDGVRHRGPRGGVGRPLSRPRIDPGIQLAGGRGRARLRGGPPDLGGEAAGIPVDTRAGPPPRRSGHRSERRRLDAAGKAGRIMTGYLSYKSWDDNMEFVNIAEFRQNASAVFDRLEQHGEVVVLKNGRPVGFLVAAGASDLDAFRVAFHRARAQRAAERLRASAIAPK